MEPNDFDDHKDTSALSYSPTFKALNPIDMSNLDLDIDNVSLCSGISDSPETKKFELENFHDFLRPSRVDLRSAKDDSKPACKFHNPADTIINKGNVGKPTVEAIFTSTVEGKPQNLLTKSFKDHSTSILHQSKAADGSPVKKQQPTTPKKSNITIFNLLNSPLGSPRGFEQPRQGAPPRRGSIDQLGKTLTSSFLHLMYGNASPSPASSIKAVNHESPPDGIKKLRKGLRDPISIPNEIKSRRLPPSSMDKEFRSGSHSSLTIGNKTARIEGLPKKSVRNSRSQSSFKQVLSESLLF
ncbi:hypothetical protein CJJ09_003729 [Candidozyma auris]|nr:hypothetical protein CJJ09_003729 [[Candida] auris]